MLAALIFVGLISGQLMKIQLGTNGGITILDLSVIILCIFFITRCKEKLKFPIWLKSALLFVSIAILSLLFTPLDLKLEEYFTAFSYTLRFLLFIILGYLISLKSPDFKKRIPDVLIFSGFSLALVGLLQLIFLPNLIFLTKYGWDPHYFRTASTFLDPNFLGSFFVLTLILLSQNHQKRWDLIIFFVVFIALLTTFSRGAYLAFLGGFITISIFQKSLRLALITVLLFSILILGFMTYERLVSQPRGIDRAQSARFRFNTWFQGIRLFQTYPILGVGFNSYKYALREENLGDEQFLQSHGSSTNDSSLLYVASTTGILGFSAFMLFIFSLFITGLESFYSENKFGLVLIAGLISLIIQSFFANTLFYPHLLLWLLFITSLNKNV